jgi:hypothetical protein
MYITCSPKYLKIYHFQKRQIWSAPWTTNMTIFWQVMGRLCVVLNG